MKATCRTYPKPILEIGIEDNIELIFRKYYKYVCSCIYKMIPDASLTEDLAQDIFVELWKKRERIKIRTSLQAYLKKAAVNRTLNHIRKKQILSNADDTDVLLNIPVLESNETLEYQEMQEYFNNVIDQFPEKCRVVFMLSRFEKYSNREIAEELGIAIKTVENQISQALRKLRKAIKIYNEQMEREISHLHYA